MLYGVFGIVVVSLSVVRLSVSNVCG